MSLFSTVLFPAFVYPTRLNEKTSFLLFLFVSFICSIPTSFDFRCVILSFIRRRSISSCFSPGPRNPIPPSIRERCVHCPFKRERLYCNCASSTCNLLCFVCACWAKISSINCDRSMIRFSVVLDKFLSCDGVRLSSKIMMFASSLLASEPISFAFPDPIKYAG